VTRVGVLALQGDVSEHVLAMQRALFGRGEVLEIRRPGEISGCDGLVLPGGESTSISRQLEISGMAQELKAAARSGMPSSQRAQAWCWSRERSKAMPRSGRLG